MQLFVLFRFVSFVVFTSCGDMKPCSAYVGHLTRNKHAHIIFESGGYYTPSPLRNRSVLTRRRHWQQRSDRERLQNEEERREARAVRGGQQSQTPKMRGADPDQPRTAANRGRRSRVSAAARARRRGGEEKGEQNRLGFPKTQKTLRKTVKPKGSH